MIKNIAFFAYAVSDIEKARAFYEGVLGLRPNGEFDKDPNSQWIEYGIGETTLGIGCAPGMWEPSPKGASAALEVDDFDKALALVKEKGVPIIMGPHDFPPCRMVVIADPDGNRITLHKRKQK
ncbi:MAG: VOC family protein [Patescibacteria group bacterium]|nr:VOC family protein [Patescibacteria group bacterium]MDE2116432.1 VOC family protein [Patescibacteria group bacterium]